MNGHSHTFSGTTSGMSANSSGKRGTRVSNSSSNGSGSNRYTPYTFGNISIDMIKQRVLHQRPDDNYTASNELYFTINVSHTHTYSGMTSSATPSCSSTTSTGKFTGTAGTTSSSGSGASFSILPPYIVKYCWERTA